MVDALLRLATHGVLIGPERGFGVSSRTQDFSRVRVPHLSGLSNDSGPQGRKRPWY